MTHCHHCHCYYHQKHHYHHHFHHHKHHHHWYVIITIIIRHVQLLYAAIQVYWHPYSIVKHNIYTFVLHHPLNTQHSLCQKTSQELQNCSNQTKTGMIERKAWLVLVALHVVNVRNRKRGNSSLQLANEDDMIFRYRIFQYTPAPSECIGIGCPFTNKRVFNHWLMAVPSVAWGKSFLSW